MKNKIQKPRRKTAKPKDPSPYPKGWNRKRTQALIHYYENQSDDQAIAEDDAAYREPKTTMMHVPKDLVRRVQKLIAKRAG